MAKASTLSLSKGVSSSHRRRLAFAGDSYLFFDRIFSWRPFYRFSRFGDWTVPRFPEAFARIGFDLFECIRTGKRVPNIGNVERVVLDSVCCIPQHPALLSYWYDASIHSMVGLQLGFDLVRHEGKYFVLESNFGPSLRPQRRQLYDSTFDPIVSKVVATAHSLGFGTLVPFALHWHSMYVEEFKRAGRQQGITVIPSDRPFVKPQHANSMLALPQPLPPDTMYFIGSGLQTPLIQYVDNKWYTAKWLENAIENELPADTLVATPPTYDRLTLPPGDHGPLWPNLIVKLTNSAKSRHVIAGRFEDVDEARKTLKIGGASEIPQELRLDPLRRLHIRTGRDRIIYQAYIPPDLDEQGCAQVIRLHVFVSPLRTVYLSAHRMVAKRCLPQQAPRGIIREDDTFIMNDAKYVRVSPQMEDELRIVADHLGQSIQRAVERKFETRNGGEQPA